VRERDDIDPPLAACHELHGSDLFDERACWEELLDRDAAHRQNQSGLEQLDFALQPRAAIEQLFRTRHAISAFRILAGETAASSGDVDASAELLFVQAQREEPLEELFARGPRKGAAERGLFVARSLPDEEHSGLHWSPHDRRPMHVRAQPACAQGALVGFEEMQGGFHRGTVDSAAPCLARPAETSSTRGSNLLHNVGKTVEQCLEAGLEQ